jgi:hypothetical protein
MELNKFVKKTIKEVIKGVESVGNDTNGAHVHSSHSVYTIDFEVLLIEVSGKENKAGIGVFLSNVGIGKSIKKDEKNASHTKINFSVPIEY